MRKKDVAIVLGPTKSYVAQLACVLIGLKKNSRLQYDEIVVLHDGISDAEQKNLRRIGLPLVFRYYANAGKLNLAEDVRERYSVMSFARFECFRLLDEYTTVIWHDLDIIINKDTSGLLAYARTTGIAFPGSEHGHLVIHNFKNPVKEYAMYTPQYNAGVFVLRDTLKDYARYTDWCYNTTNELKDRISWGEQSVLNLLIQEFSLDVEEIDSRQYNCHPTMPHAPDAAVIHFLGPHKPWNNMEMDEAFPAWRAANMEWQSLAGCDSFTPKVSVLMVIADRMHFFETAVTSILNQTLREFEYIIVVDKSAQQDAIVQRLKAYNDHRIVLIVNKERLDFSDSLNAGIATARGEYIARFDDDDYSVAERLQIQSDFLDRHTNIAIVGSYMRCFGLEHYDMDDVALDDASIKARLLKKTEIYHPAAMLRKSSLQKYNLRYAPHAAAEDYDLWARAVRHCAFANIPQKLVWYRRHGRNVPVTHRAALKTSSLAVMRMQFTSYLGLTPTADELRMLYPWDTPLADLPFPDYALGMYHTFCKKMLAANKKARFYDQEALKKAFPHCRCFTLNCTLRRLKMKLLPPVKKALHALRDMLRT